MLELQNTCIYQFDCMLDFQNTCIYQFDSFIFCSSLTNPPPRPPPHTLHPPLSPLPALFQQNTSAGAPLFFTTRMVTLVQ